MKAILAILFVIAIGLLSMWLAKAIGNVPIAWGLGFFTAAVFRLLDDLLTKWLSK